MNQTRARTLNTKPVIPGPIYYWMSRDQRIRDNWSLIYALELAAKHNSYAGIVFNLVPNFLEATWRHYSFMLEGLKQLETKARELNIPFYVLSGNPAETIPEFCASHQVGAVVTDFSPLRIYKKWQEDVATSLNVSVIQVDAHNIVPAWVISQKQEFAAYTIRPKVNKSLDEFLEEYPEVLPVKAGKTSSNIDWKSLEKTLCVNREIEPVTWCVSGEKAAEDTLFSFLNTRLQQYNEERNDPNKDAQSNLSPYLHFGQISAQRIALETQKIHSNQASIDSFMEELIVRRELSDNFCLYNEHYDTFLGFPEWAQKTLNEHRLDNREYTYLLKEFEGATTHDPLWNAAQHEMAENGKMHGYMRMYWAKKILEWTESPEEAQKIAIYLNDTYSLDGRDPNGYTGIAWSIGGVHDRAWTERAVYGKIRYMNYNGCKRKFNVDAYINQHST